jgi:hypothetical protein
MVILKTLPLGRYPRIGIFSQAEAVWKNKHSHLFDITSNVFKNNDKLGEKDILGQPSKNPLPKQRQQTIHCIHCILP